VWLQTQDAAVAGEALPMEALCTADDAALFLCCRVGERWQRMPMRRVHAYHYVGEVPAEALRPGRLGCAVALRREGRVTSFPGGLAGWPGQAPERRPEVLFDATQLREAPEAKVVNCPGARAQAAVAEGALRVTSSALDPGRDTVVEVRVPLRPPTAADLPIVRIRARSLEPATTAAQITVIQDNGRTYATNVSLSSAFREVDVPLEEWWGCWGTWGGRLEPQRARELSIAYGTWILNAAAAQPQGLEVAAVALVPRPSTWELPVQPLGPPVPLLVPEVVARRHRWQPGLRLMVVPGPTGESALEMAHAGFGPPPDCVVISWTVPPQSPARRRVLAQCDVLRLKLRHRAPAARALQVGLTEDDGAPWGVDVPVTADWQTVAVPLTRLQFFRQWAHPEGRGGGGDRFRPERLQQVTLAFGAWLDPARAAEPHIIQVAGVELARSEDATEW
jgi:hypothetical protein